MNTKSPRIVQNVSKTDSLQTSKCMWIDYSLISYCLIFLVIKLYFLCIFK